ncbi:extracellular solute-binding protein, family 5 [Methanospirillum hungatei JF-1]|uniref:Extracellular solute-binding protein, family 5 n=1 Tax=Methanospirillum hungatei JF-1 (strain ATCC 27890 / DSM 864 / NBRC 100397 / JF-1) TaxID=323259 RepID=Q2FMZ6_METHJ|nr:ABC transporter substrate-binding protein [Methanospirillum hungatei]ABD39990.1 extracellular solute-binding protein, family 5 [Methanospirillum hungatei JF-1]
MKKIYGLLLVLLMAGFLLGAGCTSTDTTQKPVDTASEKPAVTITPTEAPSEKVLRVGDLWAVSSINPGDGHDGGTFVTEKAIVTETLIGANDKFELTPNLALSWYQVDDTTWEFKIRPGVHFHNGKEMKAADVKASLDRTANLSPSTATLMSYDRCEVVDDYTIRIHTKELNPLVPGILHYPDTAIVSGDSYAADGTFTHPIGTGPMKVESFDEQTGTLTVVKNTDWWKGQANFDKMIIRGYESPATRAMMIENGDLEFTCDPPYSEVDRLDAIDGIRVEKYNTPRLYKIDCNLNNPVMADKNVRKAISHAIDRTGIAKNVLYGVGSPAGGVFIPSMKWKNTTLQPYEYNVSLAKQYLAESGWTDTNNDGYVDKKGEPLTLKFFTYTERPGLPPMQEAISANLENIGIKVEQVAMENAVLSKAMGDDWDLYLSATNLAMVPDPEYVLKGWYSTNGVSNKAKYSNPVVDRMIIDGHRIVNETERYDHFRKIEAIVYDDLPTINVAYYGVAIVMKDNVTGYTFDPTAHDYRIDPGMSIS